MDDINLDKVRSSLETLLQDNSPVRAINDSAQRVGQLIKLTQSLVQAVDSTLRELADLRLIQESPLEHAPEVENELEE